jgi:hypothetical protein
MANESEKMTGPKGPKGREKKYLELYCPVCWNAAKAGLTKPKPIMKFGRGSTITGNINVKCACGYKGPALRM